jgi:thioesterase domain-containing protein
MAEIYADAILQICQEQPIHLVGYSAGGWYAHAVAEALLKRGAWIASFMVLDSHYNARIHRRLGSLLLLTRLLERVPAHARWLLRPDRQETRRSYLQQRIRAAGNHAREFLKLTPHQTTATPNTPLNADASRTGEEDVQDTDPFIALLAGSHRPARLPLQAEIFTPAAQPRRMRLIWNFYCRKGATIHRIFSDHDDFLNPDLMPELSQALEQAMQQAESDGARGPKPIRPA